MGWLSSFVQNTLTKNSIGTPSRLNESGILNMNSRNLNYIARYNPRHLLPLVDNKLTTKRMAEKAGVDVPKLIGVIGISQISAS